MAIQIQYKIEIEGKKINLERISGPCERCQITKATLQITFKSGREQWLCDECWDKIQGTRR